MRLLTCVSLIACSPLVYAQEIPSEVTEVMEEKLYDVMALFESSIRDLQKLHAAQIAEKEAEIEDLESQLKHQIDLNYELKAQLLAPNNRLGQTTVVAANRGQRGGANQVTGSIPAVPEDQLIDINNATLEELLEVPTMNELVAERIIDNRPWDAVEDLIQLQGVGQMRLSRFSPYLTVRD